MNYQKYEPELLCAHINVDHTINVQGTDIITLDY